MPSPPTRPSDRGRHWPRRRSRAVGGAKDARSCGAFLVLDIGELAEDRFLTEDVPFLPPFEIAVACGNTAAEKAALKRFTNAASAREADTAARRAWTT